MAHDDMLQKIEDVLEQIRPNIQMDGGDVELVSFEDGVVSVRLHGTCARCPASIFTLKAVIEEKLKENIPEVQEVIAVE